MIIPFYLQNIKYTTKTEISIKNNEPLTTYKYDFETDGYYKNGESIHNYIPEGLKKVL